MTHETLLTAAGAITSTSTGEAVTFWILAPVAVLTALGMVLVRSAVHSALLLVANLFCVAVFYMIQQAPFLGFVQIIVYAGAIMVLFLFVLMLVGVDSSDSLVETIRGQRLGAAIFGLGFAGLLVFPIGSAINDGSAKGLDTANTGGNVQAIGRLLFSQYVFVFEAISALLVVAAIGTMVLGHREREGGRITQRDWMQRRFAEGAQVTPLPGPGVFAQHDSANTLGLLPGGGHASGIGGTPAAGPPGGPAGSGPAGGGPVDGGPDRPGETGPGAPPAASGGDGDDTDGGSRPGSDPADANDSALAGAGKGEDR
ncbi:NADH-quinone oxidoreductase subunit J [Frankia sp. AgB32]|uniref:NADH-quinone oxidoreductase subunit J n=1 Tax=Frankia sp. AgB32 TaxID=631119 RepID=UPI002010851F|nr:NADH-quinone oxidoreductase subunit J [Frankia sp. AgB32]MCK9896284.1 NADH-quinone oxidoreductase subunit J [Frankia sp. AgB32]